MSLKRSDKQYIEVEEFADYELTQCIAYEMAIRNWKHKDLADGVVDYYNLYQDSIDFYLKENEAKDYDKFHKGCEHFNELVWRILEIEVIELLAGYESYPILIEQPYQDPRLGKEFWEIFSKCLKYNFNLRDEKILDEKEATLIHQHAMEEIQLFKKINRDGYSIETTLSTDDEYCLLPIEPIDDKTKGKPIQNIEEYKDFIKEESYFSRPKIIIEERFKRPKIQIDKWKTLNAELTINLNKPLNEIIAFVTHIKNDMDKNKLLKLPIELLGTELKRADNLVCNDKGDKCFDPRSILSKQEKMADMFYIYDCLKLGYSQRKIQNEVYNYYADKGKDNTTLDPATLRKYRDIAMEYIVNQKYKEMITGVSIDDLII